LAEVSLGHGVTAADAFVNKLFKQSAEKLMNFVSAFPMGEPF
jgi:hypothetical protein